METRLRKIDLRTAASVLLAAAVLLAGAVLRPPRAAAAEPTAATLQGWSAYVAVVEKEFSSKLNVADGPFTGRFLSAEQSAQAEGVLARGEAFAVEVQKPEGGQPRNLDNGMIQHWIGMVRIPGVRLGDTIRFVQDYGRQKEFFPEIVDAKILSRQGDEFRVFMKLKRKKIITVTYNTEHEVRYFTLGAGRAASISRTTRIAQVKDDDTPKEQELPPGEDQGFLWRLNSCWRFEETPQGVIVECESLSLSRDLPAFVSKMARQFVKTVAHESLVGTLESTRAGVLKERQAEPAAVSVNPSSTR